MAEARFSYEHGQLRRCLQCGAPLTSMLWDYRHENARYCSARCRHASAAPACERSPNMPARDSRPSANARSRRVLKAVSMRKRCSNV
jgi:hypothetical protein